MSTDVIMPQMGESIAEGTITRWLAKVGEKVERDQPLFEISTDKVDAEIPSPVAGVLLEILQAEGVTVAVNDLVARIGEEGEATVAAPAPAPTEEAKAPEAPAEPVAAEPVAAEPEAPAGDMPLEERLKKSSSPLVRKIAREEGVDISQIEGSGIHGRVTKTDIMGYLEKLKSGEVAAAVPKPAAASAPAAAAPASRPVGGYHVPAFTPNENVEIEPMSKIRQITAAHMIYSKATSAHVTTVFHFDLSRITRIRARAKNRFFVANGTKLTYMPFIFKAVAGALKKHKQVNASIDGTNIVYKKDINLGMAVALDRGLIVPVLRNADQLSLLGLAKTANDLAERARNKKLGPDELVGGTFTITNPGVFGSLFGIPIINQPQVAILGIGTIEKRPVVTTDAEGIDSIAIRTMCYFSITYDHRLVDGADADHFMNDVKKVIEGDDWKELDPYL